ncbi:OX-2 membrane glycoprotein-like [Microtus oregoni]|uniref:OX-2 membrane glycoprotein-like n=1 Tax=Microtus oregoni TaxID=111838 RepID=UPI001BB1C711|nr:OX-2 membrane glycoprotein-like [Microtus oregoni]
MTGSLVFRRLFCHLSTYTLIWAMVLATDQVVPELITELHSVPGSEDLLSLHCSAVGEPAPGISIYPSQVLVPTQEEYRTENSNATVTITKLYSFSLKTVRSL